MRIFLSHISVPSTLPLSLDTFLDSNSHFLSFPKFTEEKGYHNFGVKDSAIQLNTEVKENIFTVSKLYDYYFKKTLALISDNSAVYFYVMPFNESSFKVVNKIINL